MKILKNLLFIFLSFINIAYPKISSNYVLEAGNNSFAFRSRYIVSFNKNINVYQNYIFKSMDHPLERKLPSRYELNNNTFINEEGYLQYNKNEIEINLGRKYISIGPSNLSGLLISTYSPPLDQFSIIIKELERLRFSKHIIRLDNRSIEWNDKNEMVHRWLYINTIGIRSKNGDFKLNFVDAVISTGFNRNLEWFYLSPLPNLILERKHQELWVEGSDSLSEIGQGDNDNHLLGINSVFRYENFKFYSEILIDEWQLSKTARPHMQTVFGFIAGLVYQIDNFTIGLEYNLASPWLYLNRGIYSNLELQGLPIGLNRPNSQGFSFELKLDLTNQRHLEFKLYTIEHGSQSLSTSWNAWNNFIDPLEFINKRKPQLKFIFHNGKSKFINKVYLYNNWHKEDDFNLILSKHWRF